MASKAAPAAGCFSKQLFKNNSIRDFKAATLQLRLNPAQMLCAAELAAQYNVQLHPAGQSRAKPAEEAFPLLCKPGLTKDSCQVH